MTEERHEPENQEQVKQNLAQPRFAKFHLPIIIVAAITVVVISLIRGEHLFSMALWTSVAIVVFWLLGNIVRYYMYTSVFPEYAPDDEPEDNSEPPDEEEEPSEEAVTTIHDTTERE